MPGYIFVDKNYLLAFLKVILKKIIDKMDTIKTAANHIVYFPWFSNIFKLVKYA